MISLYLSKSLLDLNYHLLARFWIVVFRSFMNGHTETTSNEIPITDTYWFL